MEPDDDHRPDTGRRDGRDARAAHLIALHTGPGLLQFVNVWDVASARAVAAVPGTVALATASAAIANAFGYEDGERIPLDLHLAQIARIVDAAGDLPVSADLERGYGDPGGIVRRAIGIGVAGGNLEDAMAPLSDAVAAVRAAVAAADAEGAPFALNARTDAFLEPDVADRRGEAIRRGSAFLAEGATSVLVPGVLPEPDIAALAEAFGPGRLAVIGLPGMPDAARLRELGVARVSYGPVPQRTALAALSGLAARVYAGGAASA